MRKEIAMHALHVKLTQQGCSINYMVANRDSLSYGRRARLLSPYSNGGQVARLRRGPAKSGQAGPLVAASYPSPTLKLPDLNNTTYSTQSITLFPYSVLSLKEPIN